jgi:hypothetical protein
MKKVLVGIAVTLLIIAVVTISNKPRPEGTIWIGGGTEGGTLIVFAEGLAELLKKAEPELEVNVIGSGGSVANIRSIQAGKLDFAWGYAGDIYLGYQGRLVPGQPPFDNVLVLGRVYGSTTQLVVPQDSVITPPYDLVNRRVAIGSSGSGSAQSAERYFRAIGIWDQIIPLYMGYDLGIEELNKGRAEAVWQLVGISSPSIAELSKKRSIRLINLLEAAKDNDFFIDFPFYTEATIPPGTYSGINEAIESFQDNTLLVTHGGVDPKLIELTLNTLFSPQGISYMRGKHSNALDLELNKGLQGVQTPLHPSALKFWWKQGLAK